MYTFLCFRCKAEFVGFRSLFAFFLRLGVEGGSRPESHLQQLKVCAIKVGGAIYLCQFSTGEEKRDKAGLARHPSRLKGSKQGLKYNHYMLSGEWDVISWKCPSSGYLGRN